MSTVERGVLGPSGSGVSARGTDLASRPVAWAGSVRSWTRLLRSELALVFLRLRNLVLLAVLAAVPVVLGLVLKFSSPQPGGGSGDGPAFLGQVTGNGVFLAFLALVVELTLILPLVIAVVAADSIAGEAGRGTLRYLLAVPAGRTRLLGIKFAAVVAFCLCACLLVAAVAVALGAVLFPVRPVALLSGSTIPLAAGLLRLLFVVFYVAAGMAALGAIGLAISTFTEHAIGAIAAVLVIAVASEVADNVSQLAAVHPYLPTHWWLSFDALLRSPVDWPELGHGLLSFGVYAVIFCSAAWARFTTADVTS
jgi:ABC-2 type transport system permease protein